jgi:ERCC4-type nuclease
MKIIIDDRERSLIKLIKALNELHELNYTIEVDTLPLGDIIISDDEGNEKLIIERKQLSDLASSIKDGRYAEQSFRLKNMPLHNHNIIYLVEGTMSKYNPKYTRVQPKVLYGAMCSLLYYKGFSVLRTFDQHETAEVILRYVDKISRETKKKNVGYYESSKPSEMKVDNSSSDTANNSTGILNAEEVSNIANNMKLSENEKTGSKSMLENSNNYCQVVKRVKKDNITPENIGEIILSQIPGISSATSMAIMNKFGSLYDLMFALKENPDCMKDLSIVTKTGQKRRVSNKAVQSVKDYILYRKQTIINIADA